MPRVSVVIPVYNSANLIGRALQSVFGQTFTDFEVIVVDDGSDDREELEAVIATWGDRVRCVRQPNGGPARARNRAMREATGDLIAFLDADDEWLPEKLERQVAYFDRHPETGLLHTGIIGGPAATVAAAPPRQLFCELFHTGFFINTLTVMVPRRVIEATGGFDERREVHIEDWDLWLRIAVDHPIGYLPEPLAYHRPGGWMSRQVERTYMAQALVIEKNKALCGRACARHREAPRACERRRFHVLHHDWGYDRLQAGDRQGAREQLRKALALAPWDAHSAGLYLSSFVPESWRESARGARRRLFPQQRAPHANSPTRISAGGTSMMHDTVYRRARRRTIARLHGLDDALARIGRSKRRLLFEAVSPMSFAVFQPVYERLRVDPRLELWFTAHGSVWQPADIYTAVGITENVVSSAVARGMKVDAYVNADLWDMTWLHRRTRRIHLFHGVAGKYGLDAPVDLAPTIATFDCLMFANSDRRQRYIDASIVPDDQLKAALVGYPKTDRLVNGSIDPAEVLSSLGLDSARPTVIYAPTWSPYSSLNTMGEQVIERLAAEGLQVIVKLHDRSYDRRQRGGGGVNWATRLAKYETHPLVRVVRDGDGAPYMVPSQAMVTDHSSIGFEFMLLDRPLVVIDQPELITQAAISIDKVHRLRAGATVVTTPTETAAAVVAALHRPGELSPERRQVAQDLFYRPGTATDRAVDLIYCMLELPAPEQAAVMNTDRAFAAMS
jgi:hypothetical protein